jgi:hypothetical protein
MWFKLTIPTEARMLGIVHDLTVRVAEASGFGVAEADAIGRAVDGASTEAVQEHPLGRGLVDIRFHTRDQQLEIGIFYPCPAGTRTPGSIKTGAAGAGGPGADEMARRFEEGTVYHRLVRDLPDKGRTA